MGWRFRRSIKIAPGVKINFNKNSIGFTLGGKGAHYTVNTKGQETSSFGIPGTGLYYTETKSIQAKPTPIVTQQTTSSRKYSAASPQTVRVRKVLQKKYLRIAIQKLLDFLNMEKWNKRHVEENDNI